VRAFVPGAATVDVVTRDGATLASLSRRHDAGLFEGVIPRRRPIGCVPRTSVAPGSSTMRTRTGRCSVRSTTG
jgi:hypothetical protein